jgi:hypothetical protein
MTRPILTQNFIKTCLTYNPEDGVFAWRERPREHFKTTGSWKIWNSRFKGKTAGNVNKGYVQIAFYGHSFMAHRLAWLWMTGKWPRGEIDHINHNRSDNRWENLRDVSSLINGRNMTKKRTNISGHTGVFWHKDNKRWCAQITTNGKAKHLGVFDKIEDAIKAREKANLEHSFHANHGT